MFCYTIFIYLSLLLLTAEGTVEGDADEVKSLPGLHEIIKFRHYAGYLNASSGRKLFYWFIESEHDPKKDPVVLWLNGGPGCSSLVGLLGELGPWQVTGSKTLVKNTYSWNKLANILFIESPAGVGFSYDPNNNYPLSDNITAVDSYSALQHFFQKFPHLQSNEFYITGVSYAGMYVPFLGVEILHGNTVAKTKINLKGLGIGNGCMDAKTYMKSAAYFAFHHGMIDSHTWHTLQTECCQCTNNINNCDFINSKNPKCSVLALTTYAKFFDSKSNWNPYNIYRGIDGNDHGTGHSDYFSLNIDFMTKVKALNLEEFYRNNYLNDEEVYDIEDNCNNSAMGHYLNDPKVREALHVSSESPMWCSCNLDIQGKYHSNLYSMQPLVLELINSKQLNDIVIFNGDFDMVCDFIGAQWFIDSLNLTLVEDYHKWSYQNSIAGFVKRYKGLTFATVKAAGHMVQVEKPAASYLIFEEIIGKSKLK